MAVTVHARFPYPGHWGGKAHCALAWLLDREKARISVLVVGRDDNRSTSVTNAAEDLHRAVEAEMRRSLGAARDAVQLVVYEAYEHRVRDALRHLPAGQVYDRVVTRVEIHPSGAAQWRTVAASEVAVIRRLTRALLDAGAICAPAPSP